MKKRLRIYWPFVNAGLQEVASYRVNWIFFMLGEALSCVVMYFIWSAVYHSGGGGVMNGFTMSQMIVYLVMIFLTRTLIDSDVSFTVGEEIRDGSIIMRMLKPVSYNATFLFHELGGKLPTTIALSGPMIIAVEIIRTVLDGTFQFSVGSLLLYIVSCVLAYLINFYFNICFGFAAFVIKYLWGANMMKNVLVGFFSGAVIPLSFLPEWLERVFLFLPFASLNYTPVMIYMGQYAGAEIVYFMGLQVFWVLFFCGLSKFLWKVSVKRLTVQGG